jgi:hypothetical protein
MDKSEVFQVLDERLWMKHRVVAPKAIVFPHSNGYGLGQWTVQTLHIRHHYNATIFQRAAGEGAMQF